MKTQEFRKMTKGKVLVTGASGFLGRRTVEILSERGFSVRALVRKTSRIGNLKQAAVEIFLGDVTDISTLKPAFEGIDFVVHTAVDTSGTKEGAQKVTIGGTRNILDLCTEFPVQKLIYISSCSVYGLADCTDGQIIDENGPLERYPKRRGVYSWSKIEAEKLIRDYMKESKVPVVCLRPGTIYGPGGKYFTSMIGFSFGTKILVIMDTRDVILPLVYIDDLIDVIEFAIKKHQSPWKIYHVVNPDNPKKREYVDALLEKLYPKCKFIYIPYRIFSAITLCQEILAKLLKQNPLLTSYRLMTSQKNIRYETRKLTKDMNWHASYSFETAVNSILRYERLKRNRPIYEKRIPGNT